MTLSYKAMSFAMEKHKHHSRKYTGNPYWTHLAEVAGLVSTFYKEDHILSAAWLHDTLEDTNATREELTSIFGEEIMQMVLSLSDMENGNRTERKQLSRERLSKTPSYVQDIKVCDLISNTSSIMHHDPKFAKVYLEEKKLLLDVLTKANKELLKLAYAYI